MLKLAKPDPKRWLKYWARTQRGRDNLSDLIDRGYTLDWPPPMRGAARNFDAVDDHIDRVLDDAVLDVADSDSCALQILAKLDAVGTANRTLCGKKNTGGAADPGYVLAMSSAEVVQFFVSDGVDQVAVGTGAISAGVWTVFTGFLTANAAANDDVSHYRDATLNAGPTNSTVLGGLLNARPFRASATGAVTPANFWDGDIAYVRFWKKPGAAWTTGEIDDIIAKRTCLVMPETVPNPYMELEWWLNEAGSPATTQDYTSNDFDGTYTGTTAVADPPGYASCLGQPFYIRDSYALPDTVSVSQV